MRWFVMGLLLLVLPSVLGFSLTKYSGNPVGFGVMPFDGTSPLQSPPLMFAEMSIVADNDSNGTLFFHYWYHTQNPLNHNADSLVHGTSYDPYDLRTVRTLTNIVGFSTPYVTRVNGVFYFFGIRQNESRQYSFESVDGDVWVARCDGNSTFPGGNGLNTAVYYDNSTGLWTQLLQTFTGTKVYTSLDACHWSYAGASYPWGDSSTPVKMNDTFVVFHAVYSGGWTVHRYMGGELTSLVDQGVVIQRDQAWEPDDVISDAEVLVIPDEWLGRMNYNHSVFVYYNGDNREGLSYTDDNITDSTPAILPPSYNQPSHYSGGGGGGGYIPLNKTYRGLTAEENRTIENRKALKELLNKKNVTMNTTKQRIIINLTGEYTSVEQSWMRQHTRIDEIEPRDLMHERNDTWSVPLKKELPPVHPPFFSLAFVKWMIGL